MLPDSRCTIITCNIFVHVYTTFSSTQSQKLLNCSLNLMGVMGVEVALMIVEPKLPSSPHTTPHYPTMATHAGGFVKIELAKARLRKSKQFEQCADANIEAAQKALADARPVYRSAKKEVKDAEAALKASGADEKWGLTELDLDEEEAVFWG